MDINAIETFIILAQKQSFSLTADTLFLTQPAISKRISSLESELKCKLFDRIKKKVILTEAGLLFLPRAKIIVEQYKDSKSSLSGIYNIISGELTMATSHHIGLHYLPPILKSYVSQYPEVDLKLNFMESESACQAVENAEIELAVITLPISPDPCLNLITVWQDPLTLAMHNDHPLLKQRQKQPPALSLNELEKLTQYPAILPAKSTFTRVQLDQYFEKSNMNIQVKLSNNFLETIKMMVSVGLGWSILPQTMIDNSLTAVSIPNFNSYRSLGIVTHKHRSLSPASGKMIELIKQAKA